MKTKTILEVFDDALSGNGIFDAFNSDIVPWSSDISDELNIAYYLNHSGDKPISRLTERFLNDDGVLPVSSVEDIADVLEVMFSDKWTRLYDAFITEEYSPLENYDMTENGEDKHTGTDSRKFTADPTKNVVHTTNTVDVYGYNSGSPTHDSASAGDTTQKAETDDVKTLNLTDQHYLTRHGNIGVTTSQQMLQSEIELRAWSFWNQVFMDIDSVLALKIY